MLSCKWSHGLFLGPTNENYRNRASEYDTYRDPVGPISAGAQVLVGAIANFITGLGELPYEMAMDIVSAGRAISHPAEHPDLSSASAWRKHRRSLASQESSLASSRDAAHKPAEYHEPHRSSDDDTSIEDNENAMNEAVPPNIDDGRHSLELEKTQTMSCGTERERKGALYEMRTHGSRMSKKLLKTIIWLPTDLTLSLSKGFHNAPKLYHDRTVKATPKVIGFRSGLAAAGTVWLSAKNQRGGR